MPCGQPIRSAITVAGSLGTDLSSSLILGSNSSANVGAGVR